MRASVYGEEGTLALGKSPSHRAAFPQSSAIPQEAAEAFDAAEEDYRRALELKPSVDVRYALLANRGLLRLRSGRLDEAVADLDAAIQLKPDQYQAHSTLAQVLERRGRLDDARDALSRAIACRSEPIVQAGLFRTRALLYAPRKDLSHERQAAALHDLEEAIRREPDPAVKAGDHVWRARLYFGRQAVGRGAWPPATRPCCSIPGAAEAHKVQDLRTDGLEAIRRGAWLGRRLPGARRASRPRSSRSAAWPAWRGESIHAAIADFHRALELTPERQPARRSQLLNLRGWAYHFTDAPRLALPDFEESLRLEPEPERCLRRPWPRAHPPGPVA